MKRALWLALPLLTTAAIAPLACSDVEARLAPAGIAVDAGPDAEADAGPVDAGPVRALVDVPFAEGSPGDNRFLDPQFTIEADAAWFEYDRTGSYDPVVVQKAVLTRAPRGQSTMRVLGRTDTVNVHGVSVVAGVKLAASTHEGSIWVGVVGDGAISATMLAFDATQAVKSNAFDLAPDDATAVDIDGIRWTQHRFAMPNGSAGWGFLLVDVVGTGDVYLHAPIVQAVSGEMPKLVGSTGRPPTPRELSLAKRAFDDQRRPSPRTKSPAPRL